MTSRAFYNDVLGEYCEFMTSLFGYERLLPMNSGVEGSETAVKLARRWAYDVKGVKGDAVVIMAENNFWGRSIALFASTRRARRPRLVFDLVPYEDLTRWKRH